MQLRVSNISLRARGRACGSADPAPIDDGLEEGLENALSDVMSDVPDEPDESDDDNTHLSVLADRISLPKRRDTGSASGKFAWGNGNPAGSFSAWPASTLAKQKCICLRHPGCMVILFGFVKMFMFDLASDGFRIHTFEHICSRTKIFSYVFCLTAGPGRS